MVPKCSVSWYILEPMHTAANRKPCRTKGWTSSEENGSRIEVFKKKFVNRSAVMTLVMNKSVWMRAERLSRLISASQLGVVKQGQQGTRGKRLLVLATGWSWNHQSSSTLRVIIIQNACTWYLLFLYDNDIGKESVILTLNYHPGIKMMLMLIKDANVLYVSLD